MKPAIGHLALAGCALIGLVAAVSGVLADDDDGHARARDLYERQEIHALADILALAHQRTPGDVVAIDLVNDGKRWVYVIQIVDAGGRRTTLRIDAEAAAVLHDGEED